MQIETLSLGQLATNCYLIWCEQTRQAIVIDPADEGWFISEKILELDLKPVAIALTHGHFDHIMGLLELKLNFNVPIMMHQNDLFLVESLQQRAQYWLKIQVDPAPPPNKFVNEGDEIKLGEEILTVLHTPGHTPGGICLYNNSSMFTGDTLFADGVIGRTDFSYSNPKHIRQSLMKIRKLSGSRRMYAGHGESF
ncbi:MBL fold metallo-hydrolase [Patescibacteria group bacterium]|nr:MBL fold metallo-hydrolase [Patescibacteria group bacterium]MBU1967412.1 MBL fold metallo-hydrolase [Patescibacteria group bacterium]MBU2543764.1 MBL fold metallo-hydrolase [Patescibacteria group bacterium]